MDDIALFYRIFEGMDHLGPGGDLYTLRALKALQDELPAKPRILDLGCGTGAQSLLLARETGGSLVALDNHAPFLHILEEKARQQGLADHIETMQADLLQPLPLEPASFDLIWSEGSAYILGLSTSLKTWKPLLKPQGMMMVSDNLWLERCENPEVRAFWQEESPEMLDLKGTQRRIERCGLQILGHFSLPLEEWRASYYDPLRQRTRALRAEGVELPADVVDALEYEMQIFDLAEGSYTYEFWTLGNT